MVCADVFLWALLRFSVVRLRRAWGFLAGMLAAPTGRGEMGSH